MFCLVLAIILCLVIPVSSIAASKAKATTPEQKYKITVSFSVKKVSNNHVGNKWTYVITSGETAINKGKSATFELTGAESLELICQATENDSYPDVGTNTITINTADLKEGKNTVTTTVIVTEDRGRYAGNTAEYKFTVTIKVKPIQ